MVPCIKENKLILNVVYILLLDIATVGRLRHIHHVCCLPTWCITQFCQWVEFVWWSPYAFLNVLVYNNTVKLINTGTNTCYSILDRWTIGNKCQGLNRCRACWNAGSKISYRKYIPGLLFYVHMCIYIWCTHVYACITHNNDHHVILYSYSHSIYYS